MFLKFFTAQYQIRRPHPKNRDGGDAVNQATPVHLNLTMKPIAIKELSRPVLSALESILGLCLALAAGGGFTGEAPWETSPYYIDKAGQILFCGFRRLVRYGGHYAGQIRQCFELEGSCRRRAL